MCGGQAGKGLLKNEYVENSDTETNLKLATKVKRRAADAGLGW